MTERYQLSFTTGGLFMQEACIVADRFLRLGDWALAREQVRQENLLQVRTAAAATRISREITARLQQMSELELQSMLESSLRDRAYLLWVAACRRYEFIRDFAIEVLREQYLSLRRQVTFADYDSFYNSKALWHAELDELAHSTQLKLRQNLFRMLREAGLVSEQAVIVTAQLSPHIAQILAERGRKELLVFPVTENDIQRWLQ